MTKTMTLSEELKWRGALRILRVEQAASLLPEIRDPASTEIF
jgi:hypothetical protein